LPAVSTRAEEGKARNRRVEVVEQYRVGSRRCITMRVALRGAGLLCLAGVLAWSADFKPYPGSKVDEEAAAEYRKIMADMPPQARSIEASFYLTADAFEKVRAFYGGLARPYQMPGRAGVPHKLLNGQELKEAYFIFDDAPDLATSRLWIKVQRPYVSFDHEHIRDITAIVVSRKK
jgi:hypothetical protein